MITLEHLLMQFSQTKNKKDCNLQNLGEKTAFQENYRQLALIYANKPNEITYGTQFYIC